MIYNVLKSLRVREQMTITSSSIQLQFTFKTNVVNSKIVQLSLWRLKLIYKRLFRFCEDVPSNRKVVSRSFRQVSVGFCCDVKSYLIYEWISWFVWKFVFTFCTFVVMDCFSSFRIVPNIPTAMYKAIKNNIRKISAFVHASYAFNFSIKNGLFWKILKTRVYIFCI